VIRWQQRGRLRELDGWRAVSVSLVVLYHIAWYQHRNLFSSYRGLSHILYYCGALGVKTFFVISGFVICRLLIAEEMEYGSVSLKGFYCRRIFRILPPLYLYLATISALLAFGLVREHWTAIRDAGVFLYDLNISRPSWLVGHTWSLAVEEQFYLTFPVLWAFVPRPWKGRTVLAIFTMCAMWNLPIVHTGWEPMLWSDATQGFACISCGVAIATFERGIRRLASRVPAVIVGVTAIVLLIHPAGSGAWISGLYEGFVVPPAVGLVLSFSLERGIMLRRLLCSGPFQALGITSYGIYLWQQLFTAPSQYFAGPGRIIPYLLPLLCVVVPLSYFKIERPLMRYGRSLSQRRDLSRQMTTVTS